MKTDRINIGDLMIAVALFAATFQVYRVSPPLGEAAAFTIGLVVAIGFVLSRFFRSD